MSPRNALLTLLLAVLLAAFASGQALQWLHTSLYQIYAEAMSVQSSTGPAGFVWVPRFTPPPPPPGEAQACYIVLPASDDSFGGMLTYNSIWQRKYGLPTFYMGVEYAWPWSIDARTAPCEALRYLQLVYDSSMSSATVKLNITVPGVLVGAAGLGTSSTSLSTTTSRFSICNTTVAGFYVDKPGEYYVQLSGGFVYTIAANCSSYIYAAPRDKYFWNSTYTTWYNGKLYGVAFAVVFSAPCITKPAVFVDVWNDIYYHYYIVFNSSATWCGNSLVTTTTPYQAYYALLAQGIDKIWYRVSPGIIYDVVVPVPVAVNIHGQRYATYAFAYYSYYYSSNSPDRLPIITHNTTLFAEMPAPLTDDTINLLDIFLIDPDSNPNNTGIALFSMNNLPAGLYSAYVLTDQASAAFPLLLGKLSPLAVFAPAGANVVSFMQINKTVYFAEAVACPYPTNTMPPSYNTPGTAAYFNASNITSYTAVTIKNGQPIPIYVAVAYPSPYAANTLSTHYAMSMRIDPFENATVYGNASLGLAVFYSFNDLCQGSPGVWSDPNFFVDYANKTVIWTGSGMSIVDNTTSALQIANLTQLIANYLANLTNALLTAYTNALANATAAVKAAYSIPVPQAPTSVTGLSVTMVQTALNALKDAQIIVPSGSFSSISLPPAPLVVAPAASAAVAIAWAASRRDEDLTLTAAVAGIALALFGVLMVLIYGAGSLSLVALGVIIAAAAAAWRRSSV